MPPYLPDYVHSASSVAEYCDSENRKKEEEEKRMRRATEPLLNEVKNLIEKSQEQIALLQEENALQKQEMLKAEEAKRQAQAEAKKAKLFSWLTFGVSTFIALASLIISLLER